MKATIMAPRLLNGNGEAPQNSTKSDFGWFVKDFDRLFNNFPPHNGGLPPRTLWDSPSVHPVMDIREMKGHWMVEAELPGVKSKNVEVILSNGGLVIKAEKLPSTNKKDALRLFRSQRAYGSVHTMVPLPKEIDPDKIEARFQDGVLIVTLPKTKKAKAGIKKISIQAT